MHMTTAAEAVKLIRSHDSVYIQGSTSIPEVLVRAMADRGEELRGVKVYSGFAVGRADAPYCRAEYRDSFLVNSLLRGHNKKRNRILPLGHRWLYIMILIKYKTISAVKAYSSTRQLIFRRLHLQAELLVHQFMQPM